MAKWCRFNLDGQASFGMIEQKRVIAVHGPPFGTYEQTNQSFELADIQFLPPVIPPTFYCVGINYKDHIIQMAALRGKEPVFPPKADIGYRANSALCAHGDPILKPANSTDAFQYEGELVVVFGKQAKHLTYDNALDCVFGYTIGNDVSERTWQAEDRTLWRAKNSDSFKPMGPWIETDVNLDEMMTTVAVNGTVHTKFATNNMIFGIRDYIVEITKYMTIQPGDVMWMGTDGVPSNMKHGDQVDITISGIGTLSNTVVQLSS